MHDCYSRVQMQLTDARNINESISSNRFNIRLQNLLGVVHYLRTAVLINTKMRPTSFIDFKGIVNIKILDFLEL